MGDGSHEPEELDWGCLLLAITIISVAAIIAIVLIAATLDPPDVSYVRCSVSRSGRGGCP